MSACPPLHTLEDLAIGTTGVDGDVSAHLTECSMCRRTLEDIRQNNAFLTQITAVSRTSRLHRERRLVPPVVDGYEILECVAQGGQGVVYRAIQKRTKRCVALKVLLGGHFATTRQRSRFDREVELAASLHHPNIVTVHDSGITPDGRPFLSMEFVEGRPLDQWARECRGNGTGADTIRRLVGVFIKACGGLSYAHQRAVLHRDLKPGNVLVDANDEPHILDFGLAKALGGETLTEGREATLTGEFMGTFAYAAPEQTRGRPELIDVRTDEYSLGIILYELLTGRRPYPQSASIAEMIQAIVKTEPQSPSALQPGINGELDTIVLKALAKEPNRRYQSVGELLRDLQHYLAGEPIDARRDSTWYLLNKTIRKYRVSFALAALSLVVLMILAVTMSIAYRRAVVAEKNAATRSIELAALLAESNIERGRSAGLAGNTILAEKLLWSEYFAEQQSTNARSDPSPARWALWELYFRQPCIASFLLPSLQYTTFGCSDARTVAVIASASSEIELWDIHDRVRIGMLSAGPAHTNWGAFSEDGLMFAVGGADGTICVWQVSTRQRIAVSHLHAAGINRIAFSQDGQLLATGDVVGKVQLWEIPRLQRRHNLRGPATAIRALAFSPDGRLLASGGLNGGIHLWDVSSGSKIKLPISDSIDSICFSPDGRKLVASGGSGQCAFSGPAWQQVEIATTAPISLVQFNRDGTRLAAFGTNQSISLSDTNTGRILRTLSGHAGKIPGAIFGADGKTLMTFSADDPRVRLWDVRRDPCISILSGHSGSVLSACYSQDDKRLATASEDRTIRIWDTTGDTTRCLHVLRTDSIVHSVGFSSQFVASAEDSGIIRLWDVETSTPVRTLRGHDDIVNSVAFSPDGSTLASTSQDGTIRMWNPRTGDCARSLTGAKERLSKVCFSPDGRMVAAGGKASHLVRLWDARTGAPLAALAGHTGAIRVTSFSPDGRLVASGSDDHTIRIWDPHDGRCIAVLDGHRNTIFGLSFRAGGQVLASGAGDGEIKLWDVDQHRCLATLSRDNEIIFGVHLSADGRRLTSWSRNKQVTLWDLTCPDQFVAGNEKCWQQALDASGGRRTSP